ncbi:uncharacterized protein Z520_06431 [Fonsecaea multimorphosa CBS 102226]|uniref:LYR motif-containing protein Cup1-like N-terminal domain-containing protein n=1 Tax=Fonsecaea multimorphosa CBS 102226 TaxID=1442371 RepID=A0A0D2KLS3_9EURO|nr:uncharacterized protein Z520_06431 [Fonsecaea multimorphosa CBS 102226]KIX97653.1 hypothetical protein Z520_06431 [Fonsecaea multimorphosa CBS 102226]OAL23972.1 hypothetical protein AYO22_05996 [Fonsecaea multimorphosa]
MPPPETNPLHIYRTCLRECSYLPLPRCRAYMKKFTIDSFRRWIPKHPGGRSRKLHGPQNLGPEKVTRLLHQARKLASTLRHANQGYIIPLENVLRMSYGRKGPRRYELLHKFLYPTPPPASEGEEAGHHSKVTKEQNAATAETLLADEELLRNDTTEEEEPSESTTEEEDTLYPSLHSTVTTAGPPDAPSSVPATTPPPHPPPPHPPHPPPPHNLSNPPQEEWKLDLPPRLLALLTSQANEQDHFTRVGAHLKVKLRFNPPRTTIWGKPLPQSRYKNLRIKWYNHNIKAALPPLPEDEYEELHDLVSGQREMEPATKFIPQRRTRTPPPAARISPEEDMAESLLESESNLILEGPRPGPRIKDWHHGRPHEITPRLLRRLLSRIILKQTPFVKMAAPGSEAAEGSGLVFYWDDGMSRDVMGKTEQKASESLRERQAKLLFE